MCRRSSWAQQPSQSQLDGRVRSYPINGLTIVRDNIGTRTPQFKMIRTCTEHLGHSRLRAFTDQQRHFWLEQNPAKASKWAKLARQGHEMAWEFDNPGGAYTGLFLD